MTVQPNYMIHDRAYQAKRQDSTFSGWSKQDEWAEDWQQTWLPLMSHPTFPNRGRLLELGCGAGNVSIAFAQAGYNVTGIDIAPTAIAWARENATVAAVDVTFVEGNVLTLAAFADASFDGVLDGRCFHCIIGRDRTQFLSSVHRVLKPGGTFTVCSMCNDVPDTPFFQEFFDPVSRCTIQQGVATRHIGDSNQILQEVITAGFRIVAVTLVPPQHAIDLADIQIIATKS
ncbi:class I SAM-dependent methyltransferase [Leptolyngbya iicbica]|uniref:Class I SAM-dependent methyltransferase n=2 Tax=Cyanophyceae TaxID=3028117 RepID=A0A4Q7E8Y0_9CYAN|nr:class I SAM-dependent methyltransferase [Leptolyngbya sp. LK]RZM78854.1 class I SAM-dependent methyltransferase [Leptolyngbya sp. LK]